MAEQSVDDVVNQEQSVGDLSPSDASATITNHQVIRGEGVEDSAAGNNGFGSQPQPGTGISESKGLNLGNHSTSNGLPEVCLA